MVAEVSLINVLGVTELSAMISGAAVGIVNVTELSAVRHDHQGCSGHGGCD